MVVSGRGHAHAHEVGVLVYGRDETGEEDEELQVVLGVRPRLQEVAPVRRDGPVVVLARAVHVFEGALVLEAGKPVVGGQQLELLHGEKVVVHGERALLEHGGELVLAGGHLVVLGLGRYGELPEFVVELLHEGVHRGSDGAEVVLLELLSLAGLGSEERAPGETQVGARLEVLLLDEEVLLLEPDRGDHAPRLTSEKGQHALCLLLERDLRAQQRRLLVERLAGVGDEGRGNAEHLVLDERRAHGVPHGVAAGLEGGAKSAVGEARRVRLALHQLLAAKGHEDGAVVLRRHEAVVLLARDAVERLEPVREVRGTKLERPLLHGVGDLVGDIEVDRFVLLYDAGELLVGGLGKALAHVGVRKHQAAVLLGYLVVCHLDPFRELNGRHCTQKGRKACFAWVKASYSHGVVPGFGDVASHWPGFGR